jgi:siroheme synthase-like protein
MDDVPNCDWAAPAVVRRGDLVLAVGTGGASPAVARLVRERLESSFGLEWTELLRVVGDVREETIAALPVFAERAKRWREALDLDEALSLVGEGRSEELRSRLRERLLRKARAS